MRLFGRTIKGTRILKEVYVQRNVDNSPFRDVLEECLIEVCKSLDIPVPLWLKKNTTEFVNFQRTTFGEEQFVEKVKFDKFEISLEQ